MNAVDELDRLLSSIDPVHLGRIRAQRDRRSRGGDDEAPNNRNDSTRNGTTQDDLPFNPIL
jgi:hypothetical protein